MTVLPLKETGEEGGEGAGLDDGLTGGAEVAAGGVVVIGFSGTEVGPGLQPRSITRTRNIEANGHHTSL